MKIHSVEAELFRVDGRTDGEIRRSCKSLFYNFVKAPIRAPFPRSGKY